MQLATCNLVLGIWCLALAACYLQLTSCSFIFVICHLQFAVCNFILKSFKFQNHFILNGFAPQLNVQHQHIRNPMETTTATSSFNKA